MSLSAILVGCIEPIDIRVERQPNRLIIEGMLVDSEEFQTVTIRRIPDGEEGYFNVDGADVLIESSTADNFTFEETSPGVYKPTACISLLEGEQYRLVISLSDSLLIVSDWQSVPSPIGLESAYSAPVSERYINDLGLSVPTNGFSYYVSTGPSTVNNTYVRYAYQQAYVMTSPFSSPLCSECSGCYIVSNGRDFVKTGAIENGLGKRLQAFQIGFLPVSLEYSIRKSLRILQFSVNKSTYDYYLLLERQKNINGTIFDPPPAVAAGNLRVLNDPERVVYGYFEVNRLAEISVGASASDSPFRFKTFGEVCSSFAVNVPSQCFDCRVMEGATHERPAWF